jgi:hypothetical protein
MERDTEYTIQLQLVRVVASGCIASFASLFGGCGFLLEKVDLLRLDLRRVICWQVALTARTDEPLQLLLLK